MRNSKEVESFWVEKFPNGIYHLLFNTNNRWIYFHRYHNEMYCIGGSADNESDEFIQEIPEGLIPSIGRLLPLIIQEKDQISFYFIPWDLITADSEIIYNSRKV